MKGAFVTFEGGEGTGKSTQVRLLAERLKKNGRDVLTTREPGGTQEGETIRQLLVSGDTERLSPEAEMLLNFAARDIHLHKKIRPALASGMIVLCDRFVDSTIVYQCYAAGAPVELALRLAATIVGDTIPDLTFILDVAPEIGVTRAKVRMAQYESSASHLMDRAMKQKSSKLFGAALDVETLSHEDRYERMGLRYHQKVRDGFLQVAMENPDRCIVIDASTGIEAVHIAILSEIESRTG
jgi:dTMP kinase